VSTTGHKQTRMPDGETLVEWVRSTVDDECRHYRVPPLTDAQIAVVISALRMHTIIMHASDYDTSELGKPDEVTTFWPMQSSIGRYFRDAAQDTLTNISSDLNKRKEK
jgi:hypothetical protein